MRTIGGTACLIVFVQLQLNYADAFIIPDEVPTLLSLIYSNIPTLKKGTDSRLGWGFRLGDRADFQVLVELGPQKDTQPLANQGDNANKRNAANNLANALYAQSLRNKQKKEHQQEVKQIQSTISDTNGGKFIQQWSDDLKKGENVGVEQKPIKNENAEEPTRFSLGIGEVDAKDYIPDDANVIKSYKDPLETLESLYKEKQHVKSTTQKPQTTTSWKDALDNVDLD